MIPNNPSTYNLLHSTLHNTIFLNVEISFFEEEILSKNGDDEN